MEMKTDSNWVTYYILKILVVPLAPKDACNYESSQHNNILMQDWEICTGDDIGDFSNACHGDSGGPVVLTRNIPCQVIR